MFYFILKAIHPLSLTTASSMAGCLARGPWWRLRAAVSWTGALPASPGKHSWFPDIPSCIAGCGGGEARVEAAGGWVTDGRVCDVIAVSRAFGDLQFKEEKGRQEMLQFGVECGSAKPFSCTLQPLNRVVRLWRHANQRGGVPADAVCIATSKAAKLHGAACGSPQ